MSDPPCGSGGRRRHGHSAPQKYGGFPKIRGTSYNGESNGKENGKLNGNWDYIGIIGYRVS